MWHEMFDSKSELVKPNPLLPYGASFPSLGGHTKPASTSAFTPLMLHWNPQSTLSLKSDKIKKIFFSPLNFHCSST